MAQRCEICNKKSMRGNEVSHSKRRLQRTFKLNLHYTRMLINGALQRVRVCMDCLKLYKKKEKIKSEKEAFLKEKILLEKKALKEKQRPEKPEIKTPHEKIPEEVRLEMKIKEIKKRKSSQKEKDLFLVEEIMSESLQKKQKKDKKK